MAARPNANARKPMRKLLLIVGLLALLVRRDGGPALFRNALRHPDPGVLRRHRIRRAGRDDDAVPVVARQRDFAAFERDQRVGAQRRCDRSRKTVTVDRQRAAG